MTTYCKGGLSVGCHAALAGVGVGHAGISRSAALTAECGRGHVGAGRTLVGWTATWEVAASE